MTSKNFEIWVLYHVGYIIVQDSEANFPMDCLTVVIAIYRESGRMRIQGCQ